MIIKLTLLTLLTICLFPLIGEGADFQLIDSSATVATQTLANNLSASMGTTTSLWYGQQIDEMSSSKASKVSTIAINGKHPYVYGEEYVSINDIRKSRLITHNKNNGVIELTWHMDNVVTGGNYRDETGDPVVNIITGGTHVAQYQATLDTFASWCNTFKDNNGDLIPFIFRMFHENDGDWFWWGTDTCTDAQYKQLFQETVNYLTESGVNNIIYCYAPEFNNQDATDRYPENSYVDIVGIDQYNNSADAVAAELTNYQECYDLAVANSKIFAICEGLKHLVDYPDNDYWTSTADSLLADSKTRTAAYVFFWVSPTWGPLSTRTTEAADFATAVSDGKFEMITYTYKTISGEGTGTITISGEGTGTITIW